MVGTGSTKFYFNIGHTISAICGRIRRGRGLPVCACNPVVRGRRIIGSLRRGNIVILHDRRRLSALREKAIVVHSRKITGSICSELRDGGVRVMSTAYPFIGGVRGVIRGRDRVNRGVVVVKGPRRPRIRKVGK